MNPRDDDEPLATIRLVREYYRSPRADFTNEERPRQELAASLGIHRNTVRARLARLAADGFFLPHNVALVGGPLGFASARAFFARVRPSARQRAQLHLVDGVRAVVEFDEGVAVAIHAEGDDDLERRVALASELIGAAPASFDWMERRWPRERRARLAPRELQALANVLEQASTSAVPRDAPHPMSDRTYRAWVQRLAERGFIRFVPARVARVPRIESSYFRIPGRAGTRHRPELAPAIFVYGNAGGLHGHFAAPSRSALAELHAALLSKHANAIVRMGSRFEPNPHFVRWVRDAIARRLP